MSKPVTLKEAIKFPLTVVGLMWALHLVKIVFGFHWNKYGIFPREVEGLIGVLASPFLHSDFKHLLSNSIPLFLMLTLIMLFYGKVAKLSFFMIYFLTGFLVWLLGRHVHHIGASGIVYGLISFVFWNGVFRKNFKSVVLSIIIVFLYSGYVAGVLPGQEGISWESHLLGALSGMFVSFILRNVKEEHELQEERNNKVFYDDYEEEYFFDRDIFSHKQE